MNARASIQLSRVARKGRRVANPVPRPAHDKGPDFGRQIFVYNHVQTYQVVYSLTKNLINSHALKQIPYNGKKTVPATLRKDLWAPLAMIEFPSSAPESPACGLTTFRKLREYRKLHETLWPESIAMKESVKEGKEGQMETLTKKARGRLLQDQKANSVADIAVALKSTTMRMLSAPKLDVERKARKNRILENSKVEKGKEKEKGKSRGLLGMFQKVSVEEEAVEDEEEELKTWEPVLNKPVIVRWTDVLDAEYAESWPETVVHDRWQVARMGREPGEKIRLSALSGKEKYKYLAKSGMLG